MNYPINKQSHESFAEFTIRKDFLEQLEREVMEHVTESLEAIAESKDGLEELKESYESDDIWSNDEIQGVADMAVEYVGHFDIYYSQTASRGDSGNVWDAMVTILDDEGLDYLPSEIWNKDVNASHLQKTNLLVNVTASAMASQMAHYVMYECLSNVFESHQIEIVEP
jgi:hypothetical protein